MAIRGEARWFVDRAIDGSSSPARCPLRPTPSRRDRLRPLRRLVIVMLVALGTACNGTDDAQESTVARTTPSATTATAPTAATSSTSTPSTTSSTSTQGTSTEASQPHAGASRTPFPLQPPAVPFPTDQWPIDPRPNAPRPVDSIVDEAVAHDSRFGTIHAVLVVQHGSILAEAYGPQSGPTRVHPSWSVAKSVTHALAGILVGTAALDIDAPAPVEEWDLPGDPRSEITPRMLLQMTSGLQWDESSDVFDLVAATATINVAHTQADRPAAGSPGSVFNYSTGSTAIVGRVIADLVGTDEAFRRWSDEVLFDPLGITSVELTFDVDGYWAAGYGADMTARDFARLGLLYLRDGVWDGQRILPDGWVDEARTPTLLAPPYGSGFWIDVNGPDTFSAEGAFGQKIVIAPDADLVVVILAQNADDRLSTRLATELVEAVRDS